MKTIHDPAPGRAEILLVMLPGAGITAEDFVTHGMIAALRAQGIPADIIIAAPDIGLYLEGGVVPPLHAQIIAPALARGITRIWLLGISLGGMGALLYASAHAPLIEGIFLLAPFLGTRGTVAELSRAGGILPWRAAGSNATAGEQKILLWLQARLTQTTPTPALYLGYATADRFAPAQKRLAALLPPAHVATTAGGHDWPSWQALWHTLLTRDPFATGRCHAR